MSKGSYAAAVLALMASLMLAPAPADAQLKKGAVAPNFTLHDTGGNKVTLAALRGKVVFLDFWATWCPPCRAALPHTVELTKRPEAAKGKLVVLTINNEDKATVTGFMKEQGYHFRTLLDGSGSTASAYGVEGIPVFVVINPQGRIHWSGAGYDPDTTGKQIDTAIKECLTGVVAKKPAAGTKPSPKAKTVKYHKSKPTAKVVKLSAKHRKNVKVVGAKGHAKGGKVGKAGNKLSAKHHKGKATVVKKATGKTGHKKHHPAATKANTKSNGKSAEKAGTKSTSKAKAKAKAERDDKPASKD